MEPKQAVPELLDNLGKKGSGGVQVGSLGTRPLSHPPRPAEAPLRPLRWSVTLLCITT